MKRILTGIAFIFSVGLLSAQDDPTTLTANASSSSAITLSWTQVIGSPAADGYIIYAIPASGAFPAPSVSPVNDTDISDGNAVFKVVGNGITVFNGFSGFSPGTSYTFRIYTFRDPPGLLSANYVEASDFTHSAAPASHSTLSATTNPGDGNRIDLTFNAASTIADAEGYVIYRKQGSPPVITGLADGAAAPA